MINRIGSLLAAIAFVAAVIATSAGSAKAQGVPWGGCPTTTICNNTGCTMTLTVLSTPAGSFPSFTIPPGACLPFPTPGVGSIDWVVSGAGFNYAVTPPPPPPMAPSSCVAAAWRTECLYLPNATCCADVCFDPAACMIIINPSNCPPGCCRP